MDDNNKKVTAAAKGIEAEEGPQEFTLILFSFVESFSCGGVSVFMCLWIDRHISHRIYPNFSGVIGWYTVQQVLN